MNLSKLALAGAIGLLMIVLATSIASQPVSALEMDVELSDSLIFVPDNIRVQPGERVSLRLVNSGSGVHTFTLFAQVNAQVPFDVAQLTAYYDANAKLADVQLSGGEVGWANFTAPMEEGDYVFVCMISSHALLGMEGVLVVTTQTGLDTTTIAIIAGVVVAVAVVVVIVFLRMRQ